MGRSALFEVVVVSARRVTRAACRLLRRGVVLSLSGGGIAAVTVSLSGCYTYAPQSFSAVRPGATLAAEITDVGRLALQPQIGSEVALVQGQVIERSDAELHLTVSEVRFLGGVSNPWQGQEVRLRPEDVKTLIQRTYSKRRTTLMAIGVAGFAALAILTAALAGVFSGDANDKSGGTPPES